MRSEWRRRSGAAGSIQTLRPLLKISERLRAKTELPKDNADCLNPASIPNHFKPLKKL